MTPGGWLVTRPNERLESFGGGGLVLARAAKGDVGAVVIAINQSLDHLRPWMAWAQQPATAGSIGEFVERADTEWDAGHEFQYVIRSATPGPVIGGCGLHARNGPGVLEIGYWVHVDHLRRGIAAAAAEALVRAAFALVEVRRLEISCAATNAASAGVPAKLGFRQVPVSPEEPHLRWSLDRP